MTSPHVWCVPSSCILSHLRSHMYAALKMSAPDTQVCLSLPWSDVDPDSLAGKGSRALWPSPEWNPDTCNINTHNATCFVRRPFDIHRVGGRRRNPSKPWNAQQLLVANWHTSYPFPSNIGQACASSSSYSCHSTHLRCEHPCRCGHHFRLLLLTFACVLRATASFLLPSSRPQHPGKCTCLPLHSNCSSGKAADNTFTTPMSCGQMHDSLSVQLTVLPSVPSPLRRPGTRQFGQKNEATSWRESQRPCMSSLRRHKIPGDYHSKFGTLIFLDGHTVHVLLTCP